jgi:hypothetical protein
MRTIFALPRQELDPYTDVFDTIALSGFERCFIDQIDGQAQAVYIIVTPMHLREGLPSLADWPRSRRSRIVHWLLERFDIGQTDPGVNLEPVVHNALAVSQAYADVTWIADGSLFDLAWTTLFNRAGPHMRTLGLAPGRLLCVTYGGHPALGGPLPRAVGRCSVDVDALCGLGGRRGAILSAIATGGTRVAPPAAGTARWGAERAERLSHTRALLNLHQSVPLQPTAPARFTVGAAAKMPLFTETVAQSWPLVEGKHFLQASVEDLPKKIPEWLQRTDLDELAGNLHALYCEEWPFRRGVEDGVMRTLDMIL